MVDRFSYPALLILILSLLDLSQAAILLRSQRLC